jgi:hypothetical protein
MAQYVSTVLRIHDIVGYLGVSGGLVGAFTDGDQGPEVKVLGICKFSETEHERMLVADKDLDHGKGDGENRMNSFSAFTARLVAELQDL